MRGTTRSQRKREARKPLPPLCLLHRNLPLPYLPQPRPESEQRTPLITEGEHPAQIDIALLDADRAKAIKKIPKEAGTGISKGRVVKAKTRRILTRSTAQTEAISKEALKEDLSTREKEKPPNHVKSPPTQLQEEWGRIYFSSTVGSCERVRLYITF